MGKNWLMVLGVTAIVLSVLITICGFWMFLWGIFHSEPLGNVGFGAVLMLFARLGMDVNDWCLKKYRTT